jgi:hypothetical protein
MFTMSNMVIQSLQKYLKQFAQDGTFQLPSTHCFWTKSGNTPSSEKAPAPASGTATSAGIPKGQLSGLISRYKTDAEDGAFASFLSEFEGLLK